MKTILVCSNAYPPNFIGGAELIAHQQAKALQRIGHRVIAFVGSSLPIGARHSMREEIYDGLPVFRVHLQSLDYDSGYVNFSHPKIEEHFEKLMERFAPDVVHMHNLIALSAGMISKARARGAKTVLTVHDYWVFCFKNTRIFGDGSICDDFTRCAECMPYVNDGAFRGIPIRMRNDFLMMEANKANRIVSPSRYVADSYIQAGIPAARVEVLWNGVNVERFARIRKTIGRGRLRFTYLGFLGRHKGVHVILEALAILADRASELEIRLVGEGDFKPTLLRQIADLRLSCSIDFTGKIDNHRIEDVFAETDVLLLPSLWPENQPVSITEAMACRTPVIASRIGGIPELVRHGITGYLFEPGDAAGLATAMTELLDNPERIRSMGEAGYATIRAASLDNQARELIRIYDE